jgi:hypothetical protein
MQMYFKKLLLVRCVLQVIHKIEYGFVFKSPIIKIELEFFDRVYKIFSNKAIESINLILLVFFVCQMGCTKLYLYIYNLA